MELSSKFRSILLEITIYENVEYNGIQGNIIADNIKIDLITKKIEIYMDDINDNVEITTK